METHFPTQSDAKKFFIESIAAQAKREDTPLSGIERQMLAWSEAEMTPEMVKQLHTRFEEETSDSEFEDKVSGLIRRGYKEDVAHDRSAKESYREAYRVLSLGDHYILVMIERALGFRLKSWWPF